MKKIGADTQILKDTIKLQETPKMTTYEKKDRT